MVQDASRPAFQPLTFAPSLNKEHPVGLIKVDFDETLSHFADWSQVSVSELRKLNNLRRRSSLRINQTLKIPLRRVKPDDFKSKRHGYHKAIQEDFYANFKVDKGEEPEAMQPVMAASPQNVGLGNRQITFGNIYEANRIKGNVQSKTPKGEGKSGMI